MDLGHEGTGAVDHLAALFPKVAERGRGDTVRPDQDRRTVFDRLGVGGVPHALAFELPDDRPVMDQLAQHVEGLAFRTRLDDQLFGCFDGVFDAEAKSG